MEKRHIDVVVISDLHLGTFGCHANEIVNYLQSISPNLLILNGDIVDGWQFSKRYFPAAHLEVINEIFNLQHSGTRVVYITGNHDEFLRRYSDLNIGNFQLTDKLIIEIDGKLTWIFHGDVFDNTTKGSAKILAKLGGKGYDMLILINRFINFSLQKMGKEKVSFSKKIKNSVKKAVSYINDFEETAASLAIENKYDFVICGHIHHPQQKVIANKHGKVIYLNSGDWIENLTSLEYYDHSWHIYHYHDEEFKETDTIKRVVRPELSVVKNEVDLFLTSLVLKTNL
ncbi:MAG TPA: UDP-2,3-diacylglucosamine diphosphatase [Chitinophagaceae bacterium]|nr:UDP-2,3-diacylglucosamine diphosphatase [Chitinophagaceae bacterium]